MAELHTKHLQVLDTNGDPYAGAKLYFYQAGTTTSITVYQESALSTPHANPVVADSAGRFAPIWIDDDTNATYKTVLKTTADVTVQTVDNIGTQTDVPSISSGDGLKVLTVKSDESGFEFRDLNYVRGDHKLTPYDMTTNPVDEDSDHNTNNAAALQELIDTVEADWYSTHSLFRTEMSLAKRSWRTETSLNFTNIRNPGFPLRDGMIYGAINGGVVCDFAGANSLKIQNFQIYCSNESSKRPNFGALFCKADTDGSAPFSYPDSKQHELYNFIVRGYPQKAGAVFFASEVMDTSHITIDIKSRETDCYGMALISHEGTADDYIGGLTSAYATIPQSGDGAQSNILHKFGQLEVLRSGDVQFTNFTISNANPAVVTITPASALANANLSNGDTLWPVFSTGGAGWLNNVDNVVQTIANINTGAGTFELSGVDSTSYSTSPTGAIWNQTGPAVLLNGPGGLTCESGFLYALGNPAIVADVSQGGNMRAVRMMFQAESDMREVIRFDTGSAAATVQEVFFGVHGLNQHFRDHVIGYGGTGSVSFHHLGLHITNMGTAPTNGIFEDVTKFNVRDADIKVPLAAAFKTPYSNAYKVSGTLPGFSGRVVSMDDGKISQYGGSHEIVAHSAVALSAHTGTTDETILKTINMPANYPGVNGRVFVRCMVTCTASANAKTLRVRLNGVAGTVTASQASGSSDAVLVLESIIDTRNAINSQVSGPTSFIGVGGDNNAVVTSTQTFTSAWTIDITGELASAGESITLESYSVEVMRANA
jgi:hypothetical protein